MKKLLFTTLSILYLLCSTSFAEYTPLFESRVESAGNWYGSFFGGGALFENINFLADSGSSEPIRLKYEIGYAVGGAFGYRILPYNLRFEGQYTYSRFDIDLGEDSVVGPTSVTGDPMPVERVPGDGGFGSVDLATTTITTMTEGFGGHTIMHSPFFNAYYDFTQIGDLGHPYIGIGAGYQRVSFNILHTSTSSIQTKRPGAEGIAGTETMQEEPAIPEVDETVTTTVKEKFVTRPGRFAYQFIAGIILGDGDLTVDINYRYIRFQKLSTTIGVDNMMGGFTEVRFTPRRAHTVHLATIGFNFPLNNTGI